MRSNLGILGGPSAIGSVSLGLMEQAEDIDAITRYMTTVAVKTDAARKKQDEYKLWIDTVSWYDKNYDRPTLDRARNLRNEFNLANTTTAAEKAQVTQVITTGMTSEEQRGDPRRISSDGKFSELPESTAPPLPTWAKWTIGAAVGVGALYALGQITTLVKVLKGSPTHASNPSRRRRARR